MPQTLKVNILILNFNGKELLKKYLPSFLQAQKRSRHICRVGVVDNQSTDGSVEFLRSQFPAVEVHVAPQNKVLCSYNDFAKSLNDDILILMNNDIQVGENFIDPLAEPFLADRDVFFTTPKCVGNDGSYEGNKTRGRVRFGIYWSTALYPGHEHEISRLGPTLQGGFGAFDRKKFVALGGYDDLYLPGRLEDADLCFRAYKRGWKCLYQPESVVTHQGGVSFHKVFGVQRTLVINWRNTFLFMWKNLSDKLILLSCAFWLPTRLLWSILSGKPELFLGYVEALPLKKEAKKRKAVLKQAGLLRSVSDQKIFAEV